MIQSLTCSAPTILSKIAAVVAACVFGILAAYRCLLTWRHRQWEYRLESAHRRPRGSLLPTSLVLHELPVSSLPQANLLPVGEVGLTAIAETINEVSEPFIVCNRNKQQWCS